jgi:hypothetical protein
MAQTCSDCPSLGVYTSMLLEDGASPHTFDTNSSRFEFLSETISPEGRHVQSDGITGLPYSLADTVRDGGSIVRGSVLMNPSSKTFEIWGKYLLGALVSTTFTPDNCVNPFGLLVDVDNDTFEFKDMYVDSWALFGEAPEIPGNEQAQPDLLTLQVNVLGKTAAQGTAWPSVTPGTAAALPTGTAALPYLLQDADTTITINGEARSIYEFALYHSKQLRVFWASSLTPSGICSMGRASQLKFRLPWNEANEDLYNGGITGAAATLKFTIAGVSSQFNITNLKIPNQAPIIRRKREAVLFELVGSIHGTTAATEMTLTNDSTP